MCTMGPCGMHSEVFQCSSPSCGQTITAEGRQHYIVIHNLTSAATHALMRRELQGVVISNGTITGRLSHYHSLVTSHAYFGIIPPEPVCRSVRTLVKLCSIMLRLMCSSPSGSLFHCKICEYDEEGNKRHRLQGVMHGRDYPRGSEILSPSLQEHF